MTHRDGYDVMESRVGVTWKDLEWMRRHERLGNRNGGGKISKFYGEMGKMRCMGQGGYFFNGF